MHSAILISALPFAFAGKLEIESQIAAVNNSTSSARNLIPILGPQLSQIDGYGCWCYFDGDYNKGRGQPASLIDASCQQLHNGYKCAMVDAEMEADDDCVPWEVPYFAGSHFGEAMLVEKCDELNPTDQCASRACKVEGWFVISIFQAFFDPESGHSSALLHDNGFDTTTECPTKTGVKSDYECCGTYPFSIRPFKTMNGDRACCQGKTYDAQIYSCCDDGSRQISCPL